MPSSSMPDVLREIRAVLTGIPGLLPDEYPSEQNEQPVFCLVYPGQGRAQLGTSRGGTGHPSYWEFDTVIIDIVTPRSDMLSDFKAVERYPGLVPSALMAAFSDHKFNGYVAVMSDPTAPGSTWPIRRALIYPQAGGVDMLGYRFEVDLAYQVEILHD